MRGNPDMMRKFIVSGTHEFTFAVEVEATDEDDAQNQIDDLWAIDELLEYETGYHRDVNDVTEVSGEEERAPDPVDAAEVVP
jgi:hypothetical protein